MALRKKHEVLEEPQDYEIERRETPRYNPDPEAGLSADQVEQHREDGWRNVSVAPPAQTTKEIIRENVCTYFNLIFLVLAILRSMHSATLNGVPSASRKKRFRPPT